MTRFQCLSWKWIGAGLWMVLLLTACTPGAVQDKPQTGAQQQPDTSATPEPACGFMHVVEKEVRVKDYFAYMDRLVTRYDTVLPYPLTEHLLVQANAWIIDTLEETDYYRRKAKGQFVYNQRLLPVLHAGDSICIPDSLMAGRLKAAQDSTWLDINIPEFRLRIMRGDDSLYSFPVRVGQDKKRFQEAVGHDVDLRTRPGEGEIVWINRDPPWFIDPHTGEKFTTTLRDDGRRTRMPLIPWLEPAIGGKRLGQMIHPTTNPRSLGKPSSNGCVGCREADAWRIYYHAPIGTRVRIRYDLDRIDAAGDTLHFPDIYGWRKQRK